MLHNIVVCGNLRGQTDHPLKKGGILVLAFAKTKVKLIFLASHFHNIGHLH